MAGEREMLEGWLDFHRATLLQKCAGLTDEQLKQATCPPSKLSLLGLIRHLADVELTWFRQRFAGEPVDDQFSDPDNPDGDFDGVATADAAAAFAAYTAEVDAARRVAAGRSLDDTCRPDPARPEVEISLRWIYVHMIEEYARHNGHADLIRERIDGTTGV